MRAIAKRLILRVSATTHRNVVFPRWNGKLIAEVVYDLDRPLNQERSVLPAANDDGISHDLPFPNPPYLAGELACRVMLN
jgi:hypothetical protein